MLFAKGIVHARSFQTLHIAPEKAVSKARSNSDKNKDMT